MRTRLLQVLAVLDDGPRPSTRRAYADATSVPTRRRSPSRPARRGRRRGSNSCLRTAPPGCERLRHGSPTSTPPLAACPFETNDGTASRSSEEPERRSTRNEAARYELRLWPRGSRRNDGQTRGSRSRMASPDLARARFDLHRRSDPTARSACARRSRRRFASAPPVPRAGRWNCRSLARRAGAARRCMRRRARLARGVYIADAAAACARRARARATRASRRRGRSSTRSTPTIEGGGDSNARVRGQARPRWRNGQRRGHADTRSCRTSCDWPLRRSTLVGRSSGRRTRGRSDAHEKRGERGISREFASWRGRSPRG